MFTSRAKKITIISAIAAIILGYGVYAYSMRNQPAIYDFDADRDSTQMLEMFDKDWHWLFASSREEFSVVHALKYLTPSQHDRRHFGTLKIKVLRTRDRVLGFVSYFMSNPTKGQLLWLDVREETRGKGYGYLLAQLAVDQLIAMGAQTIFLWTRVSNEIGQKIYKKLGFKVMHTTPDGYVYFEYKV